MKHKLHEVSYQSLDAAIRQDLYSYYDIISYKPCAWQCIFLVLMLSGYPRPGQTVWGWDKTVFLFSFFGRGMLDNTCPCFLWLKSSLTEQEWKNCRHTHTHTHWPKKYCGVHVMQVIWKLQLCEIAHNKYEGPQFRHTEPWRGLIEL